jgi:hypothetical protein
VPVLVSTGSNNIEAALGYSAVITASSLLLLNYVSRPWLWWGPVIGALGWWLLSFGVDREVYVRGWYLLGIAYLFAAVPGLDWIVRRDTALKPPTDTVKAYLRSVFTPTNQSNDFDLLLVFILLNGAAAVSIYLESRYQLAILRWLPLLAFTLFFARKREGLVLAAWFAVISTLRRLDCHTPAFHRHAPGIKAGGDPIFGALLSVLSRRGSGRPRDRSVELQQPPQPTDVGCSGISNTGACANYRVLDHGTQPGCLGIGVFSFWLCLCFRSVHLDQQPRPAPIGNLAVFLRSFGYRLRSCHRVFTTHANTGTGTAIGFLGLDFAPFQGRCNLAY